MTDDSVTRLAEKIAELGCGNCSYGAESTIKNKIESLLREAMDAVRHEAVVELSHYASQGIVAKSWVTKIQNEAYTCAAEVARKFAVEHEYCAETLPDEIAAAIEKLREETK